MCGMDFRFSARKSNWSNRFWLTLKRPSMIFWRRKVGSGMYIWPDHEQIVLRLKVSFRITQTITAWRFCWKAFVWDTNSSISRRSSASVKFIRCEWRERLPSFCSSVTSFFFSSRSSREKELKQDQYMVPYSMMELAMLFMINKDYSEAKLILDKAKWIIYSKISITRSSRDQWNHFEE